MVDLIDRQISAEIVAACRSGDRDAFRALYDLYKDRVYSIASLLFCMAIQSAASDVTQQVFLKLMTSIGDFRGDAEFSTWLYRLVVNACMDAGRRRKSDAMSLRPIPSGNVCRARFAGGRLRPRTDGKVGSGSRVGAPSEVPNRRIAAVLRRSLV